MRIKVQNRKYFQIIVIERQIKQPNSKINQSFYIYPTSGHAFIKIIGRFSDLLAKLLICKTVLKPHIMATKDHKHVKDDVKYEALRDKGMSKERAAKISNSPGASKRGGEHSHSNKKK